MTSVKIYQPAKTAMSSGKAKTKRWLMVFNRKDCQYIEPVMQWTGAVETQSQVRLFFDTKEEAIAFAKEHNWSYQVSKPHIRKHRPKSYTNNFTRVIIE